MPYDEALADRVRQVMASHPSVVEKKVFGGLTFMLQGHMCCGVLKEDLVLLLNLDSWAEALAEPHARPMDFTGRPMKGMVYIGPEGCQSDDALRGWVQRAVSFALSLPAK